MKHLNTRCAVLLLALLALLPLHNASAEHSWDQQIPEFKKSIVNLHVRSEISLGLDVTGEGFATGFITDAKRGLIVTNQHLTGISPLTQIKVHFFNGAETEARVLYYDPWHDFAFLKFDPKSLDFKPREALIGRHADLKENDELLLIGNNERESYSIERGRLTKRFVDKAVHKLGRHSHQLHTDFDLRGGSSGSPLWNTKGAIVGLHTTIRANSAFALRIDYVSEALTAIRGGKTPTRGDLSIHLNALPIHKATKYYNYPAKFIQRARKADPELQHVLQVHKVLSGSKSDGRLQNGDIIIAIQGEEIGENLYQFDKIVNEHVRGSVSIKLFRKGKIKTVKVPVDNAEDGKPKRFVLFAGSTFHDITPGLALYLNLPTDGVYISESRPGTSFASVAARPRDRNLNYKRKVALFEMNGKPVRNVIEFAKLAINGTQGGPLLVKIRDIYDFGNLTRMAEVDIESRYAPLKVFEWNPSRLEWIEKPFNKIAANKSR